MARRPSGRIRQPQAADPRDVALARRIRDRICTEAGNECAGFPLGILYVTGEISEADYEAGKAFAVLRARHAQIMGLPPMSCRAIDWHGYKGRAVAAGPSCEEIRTVKRRMVETEQTILRNAGLPGLRALEATCLFDREPQHPFLLKRCLGILSRARLFEGALRRIDANDSERKQ